MGCTEREFLQWLPPAAGARPLQIESGAATVAVGSGRLALRWHVLPERRIALLRLPRLLVAFDFDGVTPDERAVFMREFDRVLHRGGG